MAKIVLSPLIATIDGPGGNARWASKGRHLAEARGEGRHLGHGRKPEVDPHCRWLFTPKTWRADCDAWTFADLAYQRMPQPGRDNWRRQITRPQTSTYDAYMRQTVPHVLRGWPGPPDPRGKPGWKLRELYRTPGWWHTAPTIYDAVPPLTTDATAYPPTACRVWGLAAVAVKLTRLRTWNPAHTVYSDTYYARVATYAHTGFDSCPSHGRLYIATYAAPKWHLKDPANPWAPWPLINDQWSDVTDAWQYRECYSPRKIWGVAMTWTPIARGPTDQPLTPPVLDTAHEIPVAILTAGDLWSHYPHPFPMPRIRWKDLPAPFLAPMNTGDLAEAHDYHV